MATLIRTTPFRGGGGGGGVRPNNEKNRNRHPATGLVLSLKSTSVAGGTLGSSTSSSVNLVVDSQRRSRVLPGITASAISNSSSSSGSVSSSSPLTSSEESTTTSLLDDKIEVFDLNGRAISISDLWKDRKAVVAFARHFGCVLCRKRADYLVSVKDKMDAAGVALILIGPGSVDQAKAFYEQTKFKGEVYADPSYSSYKALNFVSGVLTTFTPKAGLKIIQLYMEGYRQDWELSFEKDTRTRGGWQQGGIIVAGPGKSNISYIHKDKEAGDDPDIEDILKACCS